MRNPFRYQEPYPIGGTDGSPPKREHKCPIELDKVECGNCQFSKDSLCDWPNEITPSRK